MVNKVFPDIRDWQLNLQPGDKAWMMLGFCQNFKAVEVEVEVVYNWEDRKPEYRVTDGTRSIDTFPSKLFPGKVRALKEQRNILIETKKSIEDTLVHLETLMYDAILEKMG